MTARITILPLAAVGMLLFATPLVDASLINQWSMEEGTGTTTADVVGGKTGDFVPANASGPQWDNSDFAPYPSGSTASVRFDGTGDQINITGYKATTIGGAADRSMMAWIKTASTSVNQNRSIISYGQNSGTRKWNFRVQNSNGTKGAIRVEVNGGYIVGDTVVTDGEWHHVAAVFANDGTPNVQDVLLYVDGALDPISASLSKGVNTNTGGAGKIVQIGRDHQNRRFNGWIDDVRLYDEALSNTDILQAMGIPEPGAVMIWSLGLLGLAAYGRRRRK